jgi:hypothetical protein
MTMRNLPVWTLVLGLVLSSFSVLANVEIRTALGDQSEEPEFRFQDTFTCTDNVFVVVDILEYPPGIHQLGVRWTDPSGTQREFTRHKFRVAGKKEQIWAWIKLSRAPGAGILRWLDSSAGMEEFIGQWKVTVELDEQNVGELEFEVLC